MPTPSQIVKQINELTKYLVKESLTDAQYFAFQRPISDPMTPFWFVDFILRNFYHTASARYVDELPTQRGSFDKSISPTEQDIVHIVVPA